MVRAVEHAAIVLAAALLVYGFRAARVKALIPWGRLFEG